MASLTGNEQEVLASLLLEMGWVSLSTCRDNRPVGSQVAVVPDVKPGSYLLHLSKLASHTRNLLANPHASLVMARHWGPADLDPQSLPRVSITGTTDVIDRGCSDFKMARARYLTGFPAADIQFGLDDFHLFRFEGNILRFIAGVGRIHQIQSSELAALGVRWV